MNSDSEQTVGHTTSPNINDLPIELISKIFDLFTQSELLRTVAPVCRYWRKLALEPHRWQSMEIVENKASAAVNGVILRRLPELQSLTVRCSDNIRRQYEDPVVRFDRDTDLLNSVVSYYRRYGIRSAMTNLFEDCSSFCRHLQELRLQFVSAVTSEVVEVMVASCPGIRTLSLKGCERVDHRCIVEICKLPHLADLDISNCPMIGLADTEGLGRIIDAICLIAASLEKLEALDLDELEVTDRWFCSRVSFGPFWTLWQCSDKAVTSFNLVSVTFILILWEICQVSGVLDFCEGW